MIGITIAGFDPSGGAGISTDIKTMAAYNVHPTSVITTLTAQNPHKVYSIQPVNTNFICEQIDSIMDDYTVKYGKTGLLYSKDIIRTVSKKIKEYDLKMVVDPVMVASAGDNLNKEDIGKILKKELLPEAIITTPNVSEAEQLSGMGIKSKEDAIEAAYKIGEYCNVIITGGHLNGVNVLFDGEINVINQELIDTPNTHGTGCTFSAAIAANLVRNNDENLLNIVKDSMNFTFESVKHGHYGTLNPRFY